jgi:hypothetical protein
MVGLNNLPVSGCCLSPDVSTYSCSHMKKLSFAWVAPALLLALGGLAALPACDVIDNPQPPKVTLTAGQRDTLALDSAEAKVPAPPVVQRVLVEDFTGQFCGNCPAAGKMADSLHRANPTRVLVTEVHVTDFFARIRLPDFPVDYRVPVVSDELDQVFDLSNRGLPQGAVNRAPFAQANNDQVATFTLWPGAVTRELARTPIAELRVTPLFNRATGLLRLKVNTRYLTAQPNRQLRLGIIVVEDEVVGPQKVYRARPPFPPGWIAAKEIDPAYVHHNVMRAALAGTFGTVQVTGPQANQRFATYLGYQMPARTVWNDRKCSVIAYLADANTRQIVQVAEARLP